MATVDFLYRLSYQPSPIQVAFSSLFPPGVEVPTLLREGTSEEGFEMMIGFSPQAGWRKATYYCVLGVVDRDWPPKDMTLRQIEQFLARYERERIVSSNPMVLAMSFLHGELEELRGCGRGLDLERISRRLNVFYGTNIDYAKEERMVLTSDELLGPLRAADKKPKSTDLVKIILSD